MKEGINLKFKTLHMIIESHNSINDDMKKITSFGKNKYEHNNEVFLIEKKIVDNRYLWMYCQYDNSKLYGEIVLDAESQLLYLSDITKKGAIKAYFNDALQAEIVIKNVYSSLDEFQKSVKLLKKLKFTQYWNIQNTLDDQSIFMQQANALGLDMPNKITMQIEYPNTLIGNVKNGIQILKQKREQGYFNDIILIGEDDSGIEQSFNFSSVIKNIEITAIKNEDDRYDKEEVERIFFEKIR